ncbi:MAG: uroporphyrinogen-III synthase [Nitrososphaerota archaeon]|nr:uroporphyrinogen-III synthase [Nitrososphaerota archaeon]
MTRRGKGSVVVARSREGNRELRRMLSQRRIDAGSVETIAMEEPESWEKVDGAIKRASTFDWIAFTSPRAVAAFAGRVKALGMEASGLGPKFAAVGSKTSDALARLGVAVAYVPREFLTSALGEGLPAEPGSKVLLLRADIGDKKLVGALRGRGMEVEDVTAYRTRLVSDPLDSDLLIPARVIAFASPSEVEGFRRRVDKRAFGEVSCRATAVCIGPVTATAAREAGFRTVAYAREHTLEGLVEKIGEALVDA